MSALRIGELAELTDTNNETLRFYESKGLLPEPKRSPAGYRLYGDTAVQQVRFIMRAKNMGFSLAEVAELLTLNVDKHDSTCGEVKDLAEQKLQVIQDKIDELHRMRAALQQITDACCGGSESATKCTILNALDGSDDIVKG